MTQRSAQFNDDTYSRARVRLARGAMPGMPVLFCRCAGVLQMIRDTPGAAAGCRGGRVVLLG
jgi:hypothetical protein